MCQRDFWHISYSKPLAPFERRLILWDQPGALHLIAHCLPWSSTDFNWLYNVATRDIYCCISKQTRDQEIGLGQGTLCSKQSRHCEHSRSMSKVLTRFIIPGRREASCCQHLCGVRSPDNGEAELGREKARSPNSYPAQGKEIRMIDFFRKGAMCKEGSWTPEGGNGRGEETDV